MAYDFFCHFERSEKSFRGENLKKKRFLPAVEMTYPTCYKINIIKLIGLNRFIKRPLRLCVENIKRSKIRPECAKHFVEVYHKRSRSEHGL